MADVKNKNIFIAGLESVSKFFKREASGDAIKSESRKKVRADSGNGNYTTLFTQSFDGEKSTGGIGPIIDYRPSYERLRLRSWQAFLDSDIAQTVIKRYCTWMIGPGLKLQAELPKVIFEEERIDIKVQEFSRSVEARFNIFRSAKWSDYAGMKNLDAIAKTCFKNAIVGGDVLVVLRYQNGLVNIQLIDGCHVQSPGLNTENYPQKLANGNTIKNGIEQDPTGKHVRYYVKDSVTLKYVPIEAVTSDTNLQVAFLVYGLEYRLNDVRGIPLISAVLESIKKMERYKDATLLSAEERAKIPFTIEHGIDSPGNNPLIDQMAEALNVGGSPTDLAEDIYGKELGNNVAATTGGTVYNMPRDSRLVMHESKNELYFEQFFTVNVDHLCAAIEIPVQVAMSKYEGNFSASRAALKDWEHTLKVGRKDFSDQFYLPIYIFWLDINILKGKINAPGYLQARKNKDQELLSAYRTSRFIGSAVPHIDPLKEVAAERLKLGTNGAHLNMTTLEAATEAVSESESSANVIQFSEELEEAASLGIEPVAAPGANNFNDDDETDPGDDDKKKKKKNDD